MQNEERSRRIKEVGGLQNAGNKVESKYNMKTIERRPLTKYQKDTLSFLNRFYNKKGYMPSLEEIRKKFELAGVSSAFHRIKKLQAKGWIKRSKYPREITILD